MRCSENKVFTYLSNPAVIAGDALMGFLCLGLEAWTLNYLLP
jgi:hypothetical protein